MAADRVFIVWPGERGDTVLVNLRAQVEEMRGLKPGKPIEARISYWSPPKTNPQNRTLWMWHGEIASQMTERCREMGMSTTWSKDDVHETIFLHRFMPQRELVTPDGEVIFKPIRTSDKEATAFVMSKAMDAYVAWAYSQGMELTIPEHQEDAR
jgi:hypothetical protein